MPAEAIAPGVRRLLAPNPGLMTGPGTNTYLLGEDEVAVLDPGPAIDAHLDAIVEAAAGRLSWIYLTHAHPDHATAVAPLIARTGARLAAWPRPNPAYSIPGLPAPQRALHDGEGLQIDGMTLRVVHAPGHASDHVCFFRPADRLLFTGDVVVGQGTVVIAPPDGDLALYLHTLDRLAALEPSQILPGHGEVVPQAIAKLEAYKSHRLAREAQILTGLAQGRTTIGELVGWIYAELDPQVHPIAAQQVHAHLLKLAAEGRVAALGDRWQPLSGT